MKWKNYMLPRKSDEAEISEYLRQNLRSQRVANIFYDQNMRTVNIEANYYTYQLQVYGNSITATTKIKQMWGIIGIVCAIAGFFFVLPWIASGIIVFLAIKEASDINNQLYQILNLLPQVQPEKV